MLAKYSLRVTGSFFVTISAAFKGNIGIPIILKMVNYMKLIQTKMLYLLTSIPGKSTE